jgi:hypothetical protein
MIQFDGTSNNFITLTNICLVVYSIRVVILLEIYLHRIDVYLLYLFVVYRVRNWFGLMLFGLIWIKEHHEITNEIIDPFNSRSE